MLFGVKECVEIVARRKVALRWTCRQPLPRVVTDRAGLHRLPGELRNMTFDAGFVAGKFQQQLFVAGGGFDDAFL